MYHNHVVFSFIIVTLIKLIWNYYAYFCDRAQGCAHSDYSIFFFHRNFSLFHFFLEIMQAFLDVLNDFSLTFAPFLNVALAKIADLVIKLIFLFFSPLLTNSQN